MLASPLPAESSFQHLVGELSREHHRQLASLNQKIEYLRKRLKSLGCWDDLETCEGIDILKSSPGTSSAKERMRRKSWVEMESAAPLIEEDPPLEADQGMISAQNRMKRKSWVGSAAAAQLLEEDTPLQANSRMSSVKATMKRRSCVQMKANKLPEEHPRLQADGGMSDAKATMKRQPGEQKAAELQLPEARPLARKSIVQWASADSEPVSAPSLTSIEYAVAPSGEPDELKEPQAEEGTEAEGASKQTAAVHAIKELEAREKTGGNCASEQPAGMPAMNCPEVAPSPERRVRGSILKTSFDGVVPGFADRKPVAATIEECKDDSKSKAAPKTVHLPGNSSATPRNSQRSSRRHQRNSGSSESSEDQSPPTCLSNVSKDSKNRPRGSIAHFVQSLTIPTSAASSRRSKIIQEHIPEQVANNAENMLSRRSGVFQSAASTAVYPRTATHSLLNEWKVPEAMLARTFTVNARVRARKSVWEKETIWYDLHKSNNNWVYLVIRRLSGRTLGNPNALHHRCWEIIRACIFMLDILLSPLIVAFNGHGQVHSLIYTWVTCIFWTLDVVRNFCVGYRDKGNVVVLARRAILRYLKTSFTMDFAVCLSDWAYLLLPTTLEVLLLMRLLRAIKVAGVVKLLQEVLESDKAVILLKLSLQLLYLITLCHLAACSWWAIGWRTMSVGSSWVSHANLQEASGVYCYSSALHWALTQFTPASISIQPRNVYERIFNIFTVCIALVVFSVCFGGVTGALLDLRNLYSEKSKQLSVLRKYLSSTGVSREIAVKVQDYCSYKFDAEVTSVTDKNVKLLELLSGALRAELHKAIYQPRMSGHPLFVIIEKCAPLTMQALCDNAAKPVVLAPTDLLFQPGQRANMMFFIFKGAMEYEIQREAMSEDEDEYDDSEDDGSNFDTAGSSSDAESGTVMEILQPVEKGDWVAEPVLWTKWMYMGALHSMEFSELVALETHAFREVVQNQTSALREACIYAKSFVNALNSKEDNNHDLFKFQGAMDSIWERLVSGNSAASEPEPEVGS